MTPAKSQSAHIYLVRLAAQPQTEASFLSDIELHLLSMEHQI